VSEAENTPTTGTTLSKMLADAASEELTSLFAKYENAERESDHQTAVSCLEAMARLKMKIAKDSFMMATMAARTFGVSQRPDAEKPKGKEPPMVPSRPVPGGEPD